MRLHVTGIEALPPRFAMLACLATEAVFFIGSEVSPSSFGECLAGTSDGKGETHVI